VARASAVYQVSVPPSVFGIPVDARFIFSVRKHAGGSIAGHFIYNEVDAGTPNWYTGAFTCFNVYDFDGLTGNRAKVGGVIETSTDPTVPPGSFLWWQAIDEEDRGTPDKSTLGGVGNAAQNEAFCNSSKPPRFGPFAVRGDIEVRAQ
jgi:hypothetical protein